MLDSLDLEPELLDPGPDQEEAANHENQCLDAQGALEMNAQNVEVEVGERRTGESQHPADEGKENEPERHGQNQAPPNSFLLLVGRQLAGKDGDDGCGIYFIYPDQKSKKLLERLILSKKSEQLQEEGVDDQLGQRLQTLESECFTLRSEQDDALRRIGELEQENLDFANQLVQVEDVNNNLTNLYIASSRLHSTLDREETLEIIKEVVINFVGAEKFAVFVFDKSTDQLHFETGEGFDEDESFADISLGEGVLGETAANQENYFYTGSISEGSDDPLAPIVAIPLMIHGQMIGLLAIYRLFIQKEQLESIDYQLFSMLGEHAASALFSSTLYGHSERKRQTYQGFVDLLTK